MTYRQVKANLKLRRTLMLCSMAMIGMGLLIIIKLMLNPVLAMSSLAMGAVAYAMSMAGGLTIFISLNYTKKHSKCPKCRTQIDSASFMNMENFKCPNCGFEAEADAEIF